MTDFGPLEERFEALRGRVEKIEKVLRQQTDEYTFEDCEIGDIVEVRDRVSLYKVTGREEARPNYDNLPVDCIVLVRFDNRNRFLVTKNDFKAWVRLIKRWGQ